MSFSRRHLIRLGPAWLAAATLPRAMFAEGAASPTSTPKGDGLFSLSKDELNGLLRTTFVANGRLLNPTWLTLDAVDDTSALAHAPRPGVAPSRTPAPRIETFLLRFSAIGDALRQGNQEFEHSTLGRVQLFIVPSGQGSYHAVINRLLDPLPPELIPRRAAPKTPESRPASAAGSRAAETGVAID
jgi:hypothetical protein